MAAGSALSWKKNLRPRKRSSNCEEVIIGGTSLVVLVLGSMIFGGAKFRVRDFQGVDVIGADYEDVDFRKALFDELDLGEAAYRGANF